MLRKEVGVIEGPLSHGSSTLVRAMTVSIYLALEFNPKYAGIPGIEAWERGRKTFG